MLPLHGVLGDIVPGNLTSATLSSHVPHDYLQIIGLPLDMPTYQHSNNRPNIHYCVHPMRYSIQTCHDLMFLIPLNPMINDPEWVKINIPQFLVYCNSWSDTERTVLFLRSWLPVHAHDCIVWYHLVMSEFKKEEIEVYEAGKLLGLCCMDACGMVSDLMQHKVNTHLLVLWRALIYDMCG